ncbi:alpha/beta hydrolase [Nocardioides panacisoli]|uniref:alpha/beta hydrolase n=1 Tax=Nocardioides panacisoli TaxID=627624 RepID=UPI001C62DB61|nr:alpha/beta hydrolase [Nocardioides panacisoli]QYJ05021.1 alpha/beta hydrolase [Nocardioides panacisoli]
MPLDPDLAPLLELIHGSTPLHEMTPTDARSAFRRMTVDMRPPEAVVPVGEVVDTTVAGGRGDLPARSYRPGTSGPHPTVVLLHGGGFVIGDLDTHDNMARAICRGADAVVVSVDYRLAPEHPFPAAAEDAVAAVRDVVARRGEFGGGDAVAVAGDSAGGNLAAVAAQQVGGIAAQLLVYPAADMAGDHPSMTENGEGYFLDTPTMAWFTGHYLSGGGQLDPTDALLSPLRGDLADQPPAVVATAEFDPLRDAGAAYADALAAAGVPVRHTTYPGQIHGFFDMGPWSTASQAAVDHAIAEFAEVLPR